MSRNKIFFELTKDRILKACEVTRDARTMLLNYLEKSEFSIEDSEVQERITKKLKELEKLKEVRDAEEEDILYETRTTH